MKAFITAKRATTSDAGRTPAQSHPRLAPLHSTLLHLQRTIGNQAVGRLLRQARQGGPEERAGSLAPPVVHEVLKAPGQPLDPETRSFMESRFAHDFSRVRVHMDATAAESTQAVDAIAYTVGRDIAFSRGHYAPSTERGRQLLAHELAHVAQQGNEPDGYPGAIRVSHPADGAEIAADQAARDIAAGGDVPLLAPQPAPLLRRKPIGKSDQAGRPEAPLNPMELPEYIDNLATQITLNMPQGGYLLGWGGMHQEVVRPEEVKGDASASDFQLSDIHTDRSSAVAEVDKWHEGLSAAGGSGPAYGFYRGPSGAIFPTRFTPQSAPRVFAAMNELEARLRADAKQRAEFLRGLGKGLAFGVVGGITIGGVIRRLGMTSGLETGPTPGRPAPGVMEEASIPRIAEPEIPQSRTTPDIAPQAGSESGQAGKPWWRVIDPDPGKLPTHPGSSVPKNFTMEAGGQTFRLTANATEHMAEYAARSISGEKFKNPGVWATGPGARMSQVDYPLSSLAGALEQAAFKYGQLPPQRFPLEKFGNWELGVDSREIPWVVEHAVLKGR